MTDAPEETADLATPPADADAGGQPAAAHLEELRARWRAGSQGEFPFAVVEGRTVTQLPADLYIPPDALEVILEAFEGPLDLLLYLIRRQNLDILELSVSEITTQYMQYVDLMKSLRLELAAEYLVMAAMLAEIKSRMLLPRPQHVDEAEDGDPRAELIRRLQEYERFKSAAEAIDELPRLGRDTHIASVPPPPATRDRPPPEIQLKELLLAFADVMQRAEMYEHHQVKFEPLSVRERMSEILTRLNSGVEFIEFSQLFKPAEGRRGVVVAFLAIMELVKDALLDVVQAEPFGNLHVRARRSTSMEGAPASEFDDEGSAA